jgi:anti-anti-sigma factor
LGATEIQEIPASRTRVDALAGAHRTSRSHAICSLGAWRDTGGWIDPVGVSYIDSSGIGVLVSSFSTVRSQGGELKLVNLSKRIRDRLRITKVYSLFDVKDDEAAAVGSFR